MNQHLTELIAEVKKNSESVEVKVTPIRNLQNAGTPQLLQKIEELELEVFFKISFTFLCFSRQRNTFKRTIVNFRFSHAIYSVKTRSRSLA